MKTLATILLFSIILLTANCQVYKITGSDLQPQLTQLQKTVDSLKTALTTSKNSYNSIAADNFNLKNTIKAKSDSISLFKLQLKQANDSMAKYKGLYQIEDNYKLKADSLQSIITKWLSTKNQLDSIELAYYAGLAFKQIPYEQMGKNAMFQIKVLPALSPFKFEAIIRFRHDTTQMEYTILDIDK